MHFNIFQIGVGGTGSYLVVPMKKFLDSLIKSDNTINYILIDNDIVEEKNVLRQNFNKDNIGKYKCEIFNDREYILSITERLDKRIFNLLINKLKESNNDNTINIIIGCVDTIQSRLDIAKLLKLYLTKSNKIYPTFYVDSGNFIDTGQSYVFDYSKKNANDIEEEINKIFNNDEFAVKMDKEFPSCTNNGDQSIAANFQAASLLYNIVTEILSYHTTSVQRISFTRYSRDINYNAVEQLQRGCI